MPTVDQARAKFALAKIEGVRTNADRENYASELKDLPARLHTGGLAQTMATYLRNGDTAPKPQRREIYGWLQDWLRTEPVEYPTDLRLIDAITGNGASPAFDVEGKYREASSEARAVANWMKKFAEAFLE